jgi:hypothetical protein
VSDHGAAVSTMCMVRQWLCRQLLAAEWCGTVTPRAHVMHDMPCVIVVEDEGDSSAGPTGPSSSGVGSSGLVVVPNDRCVAAACSAQPTDATPCTGSCACEVQAVANVTQWLHSHLLGLGTAAGLVGQPLPMHWQHAAQVQRHNDLMAP